MKQLTLSLFGHRRIRDKDRVAKDLKNYLNLKVVGNKSKILIGCHGEFDAEAMEVCMQLKQEGFNIDICIVYASLRTASRHIKEYPYFFQNAEAIMYDVENEYFKKRIVVSNQRMIDESDEIIVYYDSRNGKFGGVHSVMKYAEKENKKVTNIFK